VSASAWWRGLGVAVVLGTAVTIALVANDRESQAIPAAPAATSPTTTTPSAAPSTAVAAGPTSTAPTTAAVSSTTTITRTTLAPPRSATIIVTGDLITHLAVGREGRRNAADSTAIYDFGPLFARIAPTIRAADLALCHLESPLAFDGAFSAFPFFNGPAELAHALADAGFDGCSTASNHAFDQLEDGVDATLDVLDAAALGHAGTARSPEESDTPTLYTVNDITVAHLSYTYWINGFALPPDEAWRVDLIDPDRIVADAHRARAAGAELVIVSMHWGSEYVRQPNDEQIRWATLLAESGVVDVIVGHHAHVIQPVTWIGDTLVLYGLGNFLSNQEPVCCTAYSQDGVVVELTVVDDDERNPRVTGFEFTPTWVDRSRMQVLPVLDGLVDPDLPVWIQRSLQPSLERTLDSLSLLGYELPEPR